jgi:hypothetical protein
LNELPRLHTAAGVIYPGCHVIADFDYDGDDPNTQLWFKVLHFLHFFPSFFWYLWFGQPLRRVGFRMGKCNHVQNDQPELFAIHILLLLLTLDVQHFQPKRSF